MSKIIDSVRITKTKSVAATGTGTVETDQVRPGESLVIQSVVWRNNTGTRGTATLQIKSGAVVYPLRQEPAPASGEWYDYSEEQHLGEGEQLQLSQASCTINDVLDLIVIGYLEYKPAQGGG